MIKKMISTRNAEITKNVLNGATAKCVGESYNRHTTTITSLDFEVIKKSF